jgi:ribonuclease Z
MAWNKGHMTAAASATLAAEAKVGRLELFHLSERYREAELPVFLEEAKTIFPNTHIAGYEQ